MACGGHVNTSSIQKKPASMFLLRTTLLTRLQAIDVANIELSRYGDGQLSPRLLAWYQFQQVKTGQRRDIKCHVSIRLTLPANEHLSAHAV